MGPKYNWHDTIKKTRPSTGSNQNALYIGRTIKIFIFRQKIPIKYVNSKLLALNLVEKMGGARFGATCGHPVAAPPYAKSQWDIMIHWPVYASESFKRNSQKWVPSLFEAKVQGLRSQTARTNAESDQVWESETRVSNRYRLGGHL